MTDFELKYLDSVTQTYIYKYIFIFPGIII